MQTHGFYWRKWQNEIKWVTESEVAWLQLYGSKNVRSGRVCVFVNWDTNNLLKGVDNLDTESETESWETHV